MITVVKGVTDKRHFVLFPSGIGGSFACPIEIDPLW